MKEHATKDSSLATPLYGAALAAGLLEDACAPGADDALRLRVVRELARDLKQELEALAARADAVGVEIVEGALRAADVANLAASALPHARVPETAAAAAHLASGAARALGALAVQGAPETGHAQNALKDLRGANWRARFAVTQVDEFLQD